MKLFSAVLCISALPAQIPVNYTDANSGAYTLPDPLKLAKGKSVKDAKTWQQKRRPEIVKLFEELQFGRTPPAPKSIRFEITDPGTKSLNNKAIRKQITIFFGSNKTGAKVDVLLNASFSANSNAFDDPGIKPGEVWNREKQPVPASQGRALGLRSLFPAPKPDEGGLSFSETSS